jgi:hypothetical protein
MRKPSRSVEIDDLITGEILGTDADVLALVLKVHLALEALAFELLQLTDSGNKVYRWSFPEKCERLVTLGRIKQDDANALLRFNDLRNDFAHIFGKTVSLTDALKLARDIEADGVDFTDSVGHYNEDEAQSYYGGTLGVMQEVGWCVMSHIAFILLEAGGRDVCAQVNAPGAVSAVDVGQ